MPDLVDDSKLWWPEWILFWKDQVTFEETSLVQGVRWTDNQDLEKKKRMTLNKGLIIGRILRSTHNYGSVFNRGSANYLHVP